jgi:Zn-dependent protease
MERREIMFKGRGFHLFRIFGFNVTGDWSWLAIFVLISWSLASGHFPSTIMGESQGTYWLMGLLSSALLFMSVVLHEVGHSYVARARGIRILGIRLFVFGGVAQLQNEPRTPKDELKIALAGPAVSAALAVIFSMLGAAPIGLFGVSFVMIAEFAVRANMIMALFNLVPGFPLDGGRGLRALLWRIKGDYFRATEIASDAGRIVAAGFIGIGALALLTGGMAGGLWLVFIGMFLYGAAKASRAQLVFRRFSHEWPLTQGQAGFQTSPHYQSRFLGDYRPFFDSGFFRESTESTGPGRIIKIYW